MAQFSVHGKLSKPGQEEEIKLMQQLSPEQIGQAIIPFFLRSLMKLERERRGISKQSASSKARWSQSTWGHIERETRPLQPHHWMNISAVLTLSAEHEVRRLNGFIGKNPRMWLRTNQDGNCEVFEKNLTSPIAVMADNIISVDLNASRPALFYELSRYTSDPDEIINHAKVYGFLYPRIEDESYLESSPAVLPKIDSNNKDGVRKDHIVHAINNKISDDKIRLLLRVIDKFERYPVDSLAIAYQHFSLCLKNRP